MEKFRPCGHAHPGAFVGDENSQEFAQGAVEPPTVLARQPSPEGRGPSPQVVLQEQPSGSPGLLQHGRVIRDEGVRLFPRQEEHELALAGDVINALVLRGTQAEAEGVAKARQIAHLLERQEQGILPVLGLVGRDKAAGGVAEQATERSLKSCQGAEGLRSRGAADEIGETSVPCIIQHGRRVGQRLDSLR